MPDDEADRPAEQFGRYRLDELLGRGGMGEVWRAFDVERRRTVAVKRLHSGLADAEEYRERFRRESRLVARLRSPHVIPIHDFGEIDGRLFLDMRYVEGRDLSAHLAGGRLEPERAVAVVGQVAEALDEAHAAGLVHRDVKPSNILLAGPSDFSYLVDFGIVRALDGTSGTSLTATGATVGTMLYLAPELLLSDAAPDHRADVYTLGCTLVEALTGRPPFDLTAPSALMYHHLNVPPPLLSERGLPGFDDVVARAMAKRPEDRYDSVRELAEDARCVLEGTVRSRPIAPPVPDDGSGRHSPVVRWWRRPAVLATVLGAVLAAVLTTVAMGLPSDDPPSTGPDLETRPGFATAIISPPTVRARSGPTIGSPTRSLSAGRWGQVCAVPGQAAQDADGRATSTTWLRVDSAPERPTYVPLVDVTTQAADGPGPARSIRPC